MKRFKIVLILAILCIFSSAFHINGSPGLKITNIKNGQQLTGNVYVEPGSEDLSGFKKISFCLDGRLIRNVYASPFRLEWDSRDFENGEHTLSIRGVHSSGPVFTDEVKIIIKNDKKEFNIIIDDPKRILPEEYNNYRSNYIDGPHTVLKKNDSELYFFHHQGLMMHEREKQGITYISSGTLEQPLKVIESGNYVPLVWDKQEHKTQGIWLMGVYKTGEEELLGFTHNESCYDEDLPCNGENKAFSLGIGYSSDNGKTWKYCGDIIRTPRYEKEGTANIKGVPYIIKGEYFYIYFWEFPEKDKWYPAVARAKVKDVINAARKGENVSWKKYASGKWNEDGLTGMAGSVMDELDIKLNMHCKVSYVPSIEKYLMITYENRKPNVYLLLSDNGLDWEVAESIKDLNSDVPASYPFIGDFYTDDCHEIDNDFYIYWARNYRDLWGARVRIMQNE